MAAEINHNVEWDLAIALSFESADPKPAISLPITQAINSVLAQGLTADIDLPPAHTAMMDGYAVFGQGPWKIVGELHAGSFLPYLESGCALKVSTGAHLPPHCSFVIPQELATLFEGDVASKNSFTTGQHIRQPGDEALAGESIAAAGTLLTPAIAGLAASSGIDEVTVYQSPTVSVIVTGSELTASGTPEPGHIRDSLSVQVTPWAQYLGARVNSSVNCSDDLDELREAIKTAQGDLVVVTGGSSFGEYDFLRPALEQLSAIYIVSEIWMRPGHPSLLAKLPDGKLVAGLPGNPLAALVSFMTVVAPAMLRGLSQADGLGVISPGDNPAGTLIRVMPLPWRVN